MADTLEAMASEDEGKPPLVTVGPSVSEDEDKPRAKFKSRREKLKERQELELRTPAVVDSEDELQDVQETHCIKHGNTRQRERHGMKYSMYSARFSPNGKILATTSSDKSLCLWKLETGKQVANYEHGDFVRCVAWSPDGSQICTGCDDKEARIWNVMEKVLIPEDEFLCSFKHKDWIVCVCYSPDGTLLCTVSRDMTVILHDVEHQQALRSSSKDRPPSKELPSDSKERSGSKETRRRASKHIHEDRKLPHDCTTWSAAFSPDGQLVVTASGWERGWAIIFDVASLDEVLRIPHADWVTSASFRPPDGGMVLTTSRDKCCRLWELPSGMLYGKALQEMKDEKARLERERKEAEEGKRKLVISKKKQKEMAEAAERELLAAKLSAEELHNFSHGNWTMCAVWSPDGRRVCTGSDTGYVQLFDVKTGEMYICLEQQEPILDVQFAPSSKRICTASSSGAARVYGGLQTLWDIMRMR